MNGYSWWCRRWKKPARLCWSESKIWGCEGTAKVLEFDAGVQVYKFQDAGDTARVLQKRSESRSWAQKVDQCGCITAIWEFAEKRSGFNYEYRKKGGNNLSTILCVNDTETRKRCTMNTTYHTMIGTLQIKIERLRYTREFKVFWWMLLQ